MASQRTRHLTGTQLSAYVIVAIGGPLMRRRLLVTALPVTLLFVSAAQAATTFTLDQVFSGFTPGGSPPYLTATFESTATANCNAGVVNCIQLTMTINNVNGGELGLSYFHKQPSPP